MILDANLLFNSISALGLIFASIYTFKNYYLIKTLENENHFHNHKMDNAQLLIIAIMDLINEYQEILIEVEQLKILNEYDYQKQELINSKIDNSTDNLRKAIIKHSLFLPQNIIDAIEKFYDGLLNSDDSLSNDFIVEKYIDLKLEEIEELVLKIRADLGVEKLNIKLKRRLKIIK